MKNQHDPDHREPDGQPLRGIRVLDVSTTFMGPYCAELLAQWGADVIKIEAPGGDVLRGIGDTTQSGLGPVFINANRGKRSIVLDLKQAADQDVLEKLAIRSDVLIHNIRPSAAVRLGLTGDRLLGINDQLVVCAMIGFGSGGPYSDWAAYDDVIQAASGMAAVQGGQGEPQYVRTAAADKVMGLYGAASVLAALHGRTVTGRGRAIEVPMFEGMVSFMLLEQQGGLVFDPVHGKPGYARLETPHRRPCVTKDGHLAVMVYTDAQWNAFFDVVGHPEMSSDPRFTSIRERTLHTDELYAFVNEQMRKRTTAEWQRALTAVGIANGPINTIADLMTDPHLAVTGFFEDVEDPHAGALRLGRTPVKMSGDAGTPLPGAPLLGEHTDEILRECGLTDSQIVEFVCSRVDPTSRDHDIRSTPHPDPVSATTR